MTPLDILRATIDLDRCIVLAANETQDLWDACQEQQAKIDRLREELTDAKVIIDKLPRTADGVPAYPGMELWGWNIYTKTIGTARCMWLSVAGLYSSRETLEAAMRKAAGKK